jgi:transcriptional regulator with GAF, ATPase, and Fis domain
MAGQAAIVVQNARLLERLNALDDIGIKLTSGTRLKEDEILESIYNQVQRLTGAQDMYIALYDEHSNVIRFPLATNKGKRVQYPTRKADMEKRGKTEEIIFTRKPILHRTKTEAEEWYSQPGHEEFVGLINPSWLGVPMLVGKRALGMIAIYDLEHEYSYDEQDLQVFSSMANQAAFALVNQKLNRRNSALALLNDVGKTLTSGLQKKEEEILNLIFTQTKKLTDAKDLYIAVYNEDTGEIRFPLATERGKPVTYPSRKANMKKTRQN